MRSFGEVAALRCDAYGHLLDQYLIEQARTQRAAEAVGAVAMARQQSPLSWLGETPSPENQYPIHPSTSVQQD